MLAILLDAGVPEAQAVGWAASSTANRVFVRHAEAVVEQLGAGVPLTEAVQQLDDSGEFRWRLTNAVHAHGGFREALAGWHDWLEAKAFQEEQAVSQVISTGLVLFNGILVGALAIGLFQFLTSIIQEVALW